MIWQYFDEILRIPRESKHEEHIIVYLENFAKNHNLQYKKDEVGNILIIKQGNRNTKSIALQAHMDMVCVKNEHSNHNFRKDPIETCTKDDFLYARETTLGADDGIGIAAILAILSKNDDDFPTIEALFTVDEETGLTGAQNLNKDWIKSDTLINLDSEEEGIIYIGCAGGCSTNGFFDLEYQDVDKNSLGISINIDGLKGGHSGSEIHLQRGNAIKILARFAQQAINENHLEIFKIVGGQVRNAIPQRASLIGAIPFEERENFAIALNVFIADIQEELKTTDHAIRITFETTERPLKCIKTNLMCKIISVLIALPHGVLRMHNEIENLVETSTNLALIEQIDDKIKISTSQRSSLETQKLYAQQIVENIFDLAGATVEKNEGYPSWTPNFDSKILNHASKIYKNLFEKEAKIAAIHAGLECGLFLEKYPKLDIISIGPNLYDVHTPQEKLQISSAERFFVYLNSILKRF